MREHRLRLKDDDIALLIEALGLLIMEQDEDVDKILDADKLQIRLKRVAPGRPRKA